MFNGQPASLLGISQGAGGIALIQQGECAVKVTVCLPLHIADH